MLNTSSVVSIAAILTMFSAVSFAESQQPTERITVRAPFLLTTKQMRSGNQHMPVLTISASKEVSYSDLDLSSGADAATFENRIGETAKALCEQLERTYPSAIYVPLSGQSCVKTATDQAMTIAHRLIIASHECSISSVRQKTKRSRLPSCGQP